MRIYNTLTQKKEEFKPIKEGEVSMYVCGPTVYNYMHIGNARPMIVFDTFRRYMEYKGYLVKYVSNFTDVDDKIIKKAIEENVSVEEITTRYINACKEDMESINVKPATKNPLATQEIDGMVAMIADLVEKGYAYRAKDGTVYYRTRKFEGYGKLSHKKIDDLEAGHRSIQVTGDYKEDPLDFVLWKPKKDGEPYWESPWSDGRPGWHIECSVMSKKYLGDTIDIHAGGEDLVFPHHENEIAQSEASNGEPFAHYWMHNAFLNVDNKKMSKSLNNFFLIREVKEKYDMAVLRYLILSAHYRNQVNFSEDLMESAKNSLERIITSTENIKHLSKIATKIDMSFDEKVLFEKSKDFVTQFEAAMEDDLNTADAITAIFELVKFINTNTSHDSSLAFLDALYDRIVLLASILGLKIERKNEILDSEIEQLIEDRQQARKNKDFKRADEIRDELIQKGILLEDTREGVKWKRA